MPYFGIYDSLFDIRYSLFESSLHDQTGCPLAGLRRAQPNRGRRSCETKSILTPRQGIQIVLVLALETERLRSLEDAHEDEDETANELIEAALILRGFFSDQTGCPLAGAPARVKLH